MQGPFPIETHPFVPYMPTDARFLLIGTFPGRLLTQKQAGEMAADEWYYGTHSHSLWHLLEQVYEWPLSSVAAKKELLAKLGMGITDVVASARRRKPTNNDNDLEVLSFQDENLAKLLKHHSLKKLYFTSKQAQKWFMKLEQVLKEQFEVPAHCFEMTQVVLPSPSPKYLQYGHDTAEGRLAHYRRVLPELL